MRSGRSATTERFPSTSKTPSSARVSRRTAGSTSIVGIILILCGLAVMGRSQIGRWVGIAAGAIGAISAIWWMPYYPIWSLTYIALGVIVIYALAAYGAPAETTLSPQELSRI